MPTYSYVARDINGKSVTGTITATDERATREQLRNNNLFVTRLEQRSGDVQTATSRGTLIPARVKIYDLVVLSRQLATLVRAGLPLIEALRAVGEQTRNETLRNAVTEICLDISGGRSFTAAMKQHPKIFSELYLSLVEAGELGGMLEETLDAAAIALDTEMEIREKVKSAFVYPIAVAVTALGVVTFLLAYVVPIFAKVYRDFHAELPGITQMLVAASDIVTHQWWLVLLSILAAVVAYVQTRRTHRGRRFIDRWLVRMPLFGHLIDKIALARMSHSLASLSRAGVPLLRALGTAGRVSGDTLVVDALEDVSQKIQQGVALGLAMRDSGRFPLLMTRMVVSGESSGNLDEMLEQCAKFFDREVDYGVKRLMTMIEPILTVFMGVVVGFILLALYLPIFNLGNVIK